MVTVNLSGKSDKDLLLDRDPAVAVGDAVYLDSPNHVNRANAGSVATAPAIGFVSSLVGATQCRVRTEKFLSGFAGLTAGLQVFMGLAPGAVTQVAPSLVGEVVQNLGLAVNPTTIIIDVESDFTVNS